LKEAVNALFDTAEADVLVVSVDDVVVPTESLLALIQGLFTQPFPMAAIGATLPDRGFTGTWRRAGAWQMRAVTRAVRHAPREINSAYFRTEGAFWGARREFYADYRLPIGAGAIHDDVEVTSALIERGYRCVSIPEAVVRKVAPATLEDICSPTIRSQISLRGRRRRRGDFAAAAIEALLDPFGLILYAISRVWCRLHRDRLIVDSASELWRVSPSTKRGNIDSSS
jgi:hypothetical protein